MSNRGEKQLKTALFESVHAAFKSSGFTFHASSDAFRRRHHGTVDIFQLVCLDGKPGWRVQPNVGVRVNRVEEIFHQKSGFEEKCQKGTPTIGSGVGNLLSGDNLACEFRLDLYGDITTVSERVVHVFHDFAVPYFQRFGCLSAIDSELNDAPSARTPQRAVPWLRCSTGAIVAKLTGSPDYDRLVHIYTDIMKCANGGFYLERFESLLRALDSIQAGSGMPD
jgi:hypothetical protein